MSIKHTITFVIEDRKDNAINFNMKFDPEFDANATTTPALFIAARIINLVNEMADEANAAKANAEQETSE